MRHRMKMREWDLQGKKHADLEELIVSAKRKEHESLREK